MSQYLNKALNKYSYFIVAVSTAFVEIFTFAFGEWDGKD